jgi:GNAT superfamily N-acetyltransferase
MSSDERGPAGRPAVPVPAVMVRRGTVADLAGWVGLFDDAVRWLVTRGYVGQWGATPFSARPDLVDRLRAWLEEDAVRVAHLDSKLVGALAVGPAPGYAPAADRPELYLEVFVTSRLQNGRGIGRRLLAEVVREATARGAEQLRAGCWAGGDGRLVRYYEQHGFTPTETFHIGTWTGRLLVLPLTPQP